EIHTGEKVGSVTATEAGVQVTTDTMEETFDRVVLTTAPPLTARLVPGLDDDERARMTGVEYQGIVCASLLLDRPLGGFYVTNITAPAPISGIIELTTHVVPAEPGGNPLV